MKPLKEGEVICPRCNGRGYLYDNDDKYDNVRSCAKCRGYGKFDWLEVLFGKQSRSYIYHFVINTAYNYQINKQEMILLTDGKGKENETA